MDKKRDSRRIKEIAAVFIKHGMKEGLKSLNDPTQLRMAFEELGPTFIKAGQILSTRPDIMPESFIEEFKKLRDNVRPETFDVIKASIENELGKPLEILFSSFDIEPIACASMAEVHLAQLHTGEKIVVKVQRPNARKTMNSDMNILRKLARILKLTPPGAIIDPVEMVDDLWSTMKNELDFLVEAQNIEAFYGYNKDIKCITSPRVYREYSTHNILVMEYIHGIKIADKEELLSEGYDLEDIASKLANNYLKQIFADGFFHADPHPGNILISENKICFVDFGMMGTLSTATRKKFNSFLTGIASRDVDAITQSVLRIAVKKGDNDYTKFRSDVEQLYNRYIDISLYDINLTELLHEIIKACKKNNISMPRDITLLSKGMMTLEGVITDLAPEIGIMDIAIPFARNQILSETNFKQYMVEQLENIYNLSRHGLKLPVKLLELINSISAGKLKITMEHTNLDRSVIELHKMVNRLVFGIIIAALIVGSSLVINANVGPRVLDISVFGLAGFISAAVLGFWLLISIMKSGKI